MNVIYCSLCDDDREISFDEDYLECDHRLCRKCKEMGINAVHDDYRDCPEYGPHTRR